ncbi:hypothetical protein K437DRAFT_293681 [Tilletiaria anomala UBC 951]|uniref:Uncharacterized protein n=1 Tax=Tilletiaria anomala (strain ATCC 24038 / CBS 436.72 / UBC 951) TaxID=1037660 RepID=A0A066WEN7_TILAU|nr:uncharacterized protein K437DRAFT_293681 [Tilletiaria anomala UBC 951]KDN49554.1 hypothetical protein K437DRAFT_293681 [Tilletiaria anomala UBC 951]
MTKAKDFPLVQSGVTPCKGTGGTDWSSKFRACTALWIKSASEPQFRYERSQQILAEACNRLRCKKQRARATLPDYSFVGENADITTLYKQACLLCHKPMAHTIFGFGSKRATCRLAIKTGVLVWICLQVFHNEAELEDDFEMIWNCS